MKTPFTTRLTAAIVSAGLTAAIFSAVVAIAKQPQADGTVRLAHTTVGTPATPAPALVAHANTGARR